jgi:hypothetical protein
MRSDGLMSELELCVALLETYAHGYPREWLEAPLHGGAGDAEALVEYPGSDTFEGAPTFRSI